MFQAHQRTQIIFAAFLWKKDRGIKLLFKLKKWELPPFVLIAFVFQESSFNSNAKPDREKLFGIIPWLRPSTAKGYSQALDETWEQYIDETEIPGQEEVVFLIAQTLLVGMQKKALTVVLKRLMPDHYILHIMRATQASKTEHIAKSSGLWM